MKPTKSRANDGKATAIVSQMPKAFGNATKSPSNPERRKRPLPRTANLQTKRSNKIPQDLLSNIAILKFPRKTLWLTKYLKARKFLKQHKQITTILENTEKIKGKLRTYKTKHLAGIKTKIATYKENNCIFKFDVDKSYFSPRLSNERKITAQEISKLITTTTRYRQSATKKSTTFDILVLFSGIAPYPIVIAKHLIQNKITNFKIVANELNKHANKEAEKNIALNKLQKYITLIPGDAKTLPRRLSAKRTISEADYQRSGLSAKRTDKFDIILMPRPNLSDTFLQTALALSKKGTTIFYHGFGTKQKVLDEIKKETQTLRKKRSTEQCTKNKITKIQIRKAGDIKPHEYRWLAKFKVK